VRRVLSTFGPLLLAAVSLALARRFPDWTEAWYSRRAYPVIAEVVAAPAWAWRALRGGGGGPSLSELLVVCLALAFVVRGARAARAGVLALASHVIRWGGASVLLFVALWGANHARRPLLESLAWPAPASTAATLEDTANALVTLAVRARASLSERPDGVVIAPADWAARAASAWQRAGERRALLAGPAGPVVTPLASPLLVAGRISGVFSPFTGEAHVVGDLPAVSLGFTACHELAHRRGFAREDEANALAFLVGVESEDDYLVHSAATLALAHVLGALRFSDPERWRAVAEALPAPLARDLEDHRRYWARERSDLVRTFGRLATVTNDAYLRGMGAHDGVRSYGRMVDLVLAWRAHAAAADLESGHAPDPGAPPRDPATRDRPLGR